MKVVLSKRQYHNHEILEVFDRTQKNTLNICFIKNQLVASYTHTLVEACVDEYDEPYIGRNFNFIAVNKEVYNEGQFRLFVHYDYLDEYMSLYTASENKTIKQLSESLDFSGFSLAIEDELIKAEECNQFH